MLPLSARRFGAMGRRRALAAGGGGGAPPPVNTVAPAISGTPLVGETLTSTTGTWDDASSHLYQWRRDGVAIAGATASTYVMTPADCADCDITCAVAGVGPGGTSAYVESSNAIAFVPQTHLPSLRAIMRSDTGVLDGSGNPITNGGFVGTWQDQSGGARHVTQANAARRPIYAASDPDFLGAPSIAFDGTDDGLFRSSFSTGGSLDTSGYTIGYVMIAENFSVTSLSICTDYTGGASAYIQRTTTNRWRTTIGSRNAISPIGDTTSGPSFVAATFAPTGDVQRMWLGAENVATTTDTATGPVDNGIYSIGCYNGGTSFPLAHRACFAFIANATYTANQIASIAAWCSARYGTQSAIQPAAEALHFSGAANNAASDADVVRVVSVPAIQSTSALTVSAWVRRFDLTTARCIASDPGRWALQLTTTGTIRFFVSDGVSDTAQYEETAYAIPSSYWQHVEAEYDAGTVTIRVNGVVVASTTTGTIPTAMESSSANVDLARWTGQASGTSTPFQGSIGSVRIAGSVLTARERLDALLSDEQGGADVWLPLDASLTDAAGATTASVLQGVPRYCVLGYATSAPTGAAKKFLLVGDSNTQRDQSYRREARAQLSGRLGRDVDFVGPYTTADPVPARLNGDTQHDGVSGAQTTTLTADLATQISTYTPDVIVSMTGTNDLAAGGQTPAQTIARIQTLLNTIYTAVGTDAFPVVLCTIYKINDGANDADAATLRGLIQSEVEAQVLAGRNVHLCDPWDDMNVTFDYVDAFHLSESGGIKVGRTFAVAMDGAAFP